MLGEHEQELEAARRAYEQHPDEAAYTLGLQARALAALGRIQELNAVFADIEDLPDLTSVRLAFVQSIEVLRASGHVQAALDAAARAVTWFEGRQVHDASTLHHRACYGHVLFLAGRHDEARLVFDSVVDESNAATAIRLGGLPGTRASRAYIAAIRGDTVQALQDIEWFQSADTLVLWSWQKDALVYFQGVVAAALGEMERGMALLRDASGPMSFLPASSMLHDPLRDYPPFQEFIRPKG
jgi:hypothetical protein